MPHNPADAGIDEPGFVSVIVSNRLVELGCTVVREYVEDKQDWIEAGLPVERTVPVGQ